MNGIEWNGITGGMLTFTWSAASALMKIFFVILLLLSLAWVIWSIVDVARSKARGWEKFAWIVAFFGGNLVGTLALIGWLFARSKVKKR